MQSLLESLLNYIMRHHHELRELRPKYEAPSWAPTNRGHGIMSWPMRHHHATIVELRRDQWGTTMRSHLEIHGITS